MSATSRSDFKQLAPDRSAHPVIPGDIRLFDAEGVAASRDCCDTCGVEFGNTYFSGGALAATSG